MQIRPDYVATMPVPTGAQEALEAVAPKRGDLSYLKIVWEPGEPWDPIQRWVIYQMLPLGQKPGDDLFLPMLEGPHPRKFGYYDRVKGKWVRKRGAPMVSTRQWELYRETGRLGHPYWVVQGDRGGHRWDFTKTEKAIIRRTTGVANVEPPEIGSLPYAPIDGRVLSKLTNLDRLRKDEFAVAFMYRNPGMFDDQEERILQKAERELWGWLESQVDDRLRTLPYGFISQMAGKEPNARIFVPNNIRS